MTQVKCPIGDCDVSRRTRSEINTHIQIAHDAKTNAMHEFFLALAQGGGQE